MHTFLRFFFYLLYQPFAWSYDWVAAVVSAGLWKEWILSVSADLTGPRLLELGHGPGHLQVEMYRRGIQVTGLDRSNQMGRQAFRRLQRAGMRPRLVRGQAQSLPFVNAHFDQVVATFPTDYIIDPKCLAEVFRILRPGGELIILPAARATGTDLPARISRLAYRITGLNYAWETEIPPQVAMPFRHAGFDFQVERRRLKSSQVLVVRCRKSPGLVQAGHPQAELP